MFRNVFALKLCRLIFSLTLLLYIVNINAYHAEDNDDDEDSIDVGVRLTDNSLNSLMADLVAKDMDVLNAGHVSQ